MSECKCCENLKDAMFWAKESQTFNGIVNLRGTSVDNNNINLTVHVHINNGEPGFIKRLINRIRPGQHIDRGPEFLEQIKQIERFGNGRNNENH